MVAKTENGWGSVYNSGAGITGGAGGSELEFDDFVAMWIYIRDNPTTAAIITYTGPDVDRTGFASVASLTFVNTARFQVNGVRNKTIHASHGQLLTHCCIWFSTWENCKWENFRFKSSPDDMIKMISDAIGVWLRHCEFDADYFNNPIGDGTVDITLRCDLIAITDCLFKNANKTCLVSSSPNEPNDEGKMRVTYTRNKFFNCIQRIPLAGYGEIGFSFNTVDTDVLPYLGGGSKVIQLRTLVQIESYKNNYKRGRWLFVAEIADDPNSNGGVRSRGDVVGTFLTNTTPIRAELVVWDIETEPNYTLETWTAAEAEAYVDQWAGATMHLMDATTYNLTVQSSNPTFGTVSRSGSNPVTAGATDILTATPVGTGVFQGWYLGSVNFANFITKDNPYDRVVNSDAIIIASFVDGTPIPPEQIKKFAKKRN